MVCRPFFYLITIMWIFNLFWLAPIAYLDMDFNIFIIRQINGEDMEQNDSNLQDIALFIRVGIVILSMIVILGLGMKYIPNAVTVTSTGRHRDIPIYSVEVEEKKLSLTFDVAWSNEDIDILLDVLEKHQVKATFFITGEWIRKFPGDAKKIADAGHDLGNHGDNHQHMSDLSKQQCIDEIMKAHSQVKELTHTDMNLFRPPYGDYNNNVVGTARDCGYYTIQWDVDLYGLEGLWCKQYC